jgi:hypothetical protein
VTDALAMAVAVATLAGSLLVTIPVPGWGGVPLGLALAMALPALLPAGRLAAVDLAALVAIIALQRTRITQGDLLRFVLRLASALAAGALAAEALRHGATPPGALLTATTGSTAVLLSETAWITGRGRGAPARFLSGLPVYLTLASAAALFAVAVGEVGVAMASVAALPLVVACVAFRRYADATATLRQTVQALGLVPELAGLAPLGHSERAAFYAAEVADELGFDVPTIDRIVTATRLHHLGAVGDDDDAPSPAGTAERGARILRDSGFPGDVADLLEEARADGLGVDSGDLAAATIRIATAFDHAVGEEPGALDRSLALLSTLSLDPNGRRAAGALLTRVATHPQLVLDAIAAGARFRDAAAGLDLDLLVAEDVDAQLLPFTNRRG